MDLENIWSADLRHDILALISLVEGLITLPIASGDIYSSHMDSIGFHTDHTCVNRVQEVVFGLNSLSSVESLHLGAAIKRDAELRLTFPVFYRVKRIQ